MARKYPTPTTEGHFWAKWRLVEDGTDDADSFTPLDHWEVVQVFENGGDESDPEYLMVHVQGVAKGQNVENFIWGPEVNEPQELNKLDKRDNTPLPKGIPDTEVIRQALQEFVGRGNNETTRKAILNKLLTLISNEIESRDNERFDAADQLGMVSAMPVDSFKQIVDSTIRADKIACHLPGAADTLFEAKK